MELICDQITNSNERNKNGPSTKKTKLDMQPDLEHGAAAIPSGYVASEPETGTVKKHGLRIHAIEFVPDRVERQIEESDRCHERRPGNNGLVVDRPRLPCNVSNHPHEDDGNKRRRIAGKQQPFTHDYANKSVKRKAEADVDIEEKQK